MKVTLDTRKSIYENISDYFAKAKKAKAKIPGIERILLSSRAKLEKQQKEQALPNLTHASHDEVDVVSSPGESVQKDEWFHKFRWFFTSSNHLAVGGRDADSNEIIIKKHTDATDVVFHTELPGSPFFVLKVPKNQNAPLDVYEEVAQLTAVYSRAWKEGYASATVFYVKPEQVSKHANSGEFIGKGSFMIRGEKTFLHPKVELCIGVESGRVIVGTLRSIRTKTKDFVRIVPGRAKPSEIAKEVRKRFGVHPDEVIKMLPSGGSRISK